MANFCLIKKYADEFKSGITSGKINPNKLVSMPSEERRKYLSQFVGDFNAKNVNTLFESKLLLKNQQAGFINWAKGLTGINQKTKQGIIDTILKLDRALNPKEKEQFLSDIVEKRLGVQIGQEEATIITNLANKAKSLYNPTKQNWEQSKEYWQTIQQINSFLREQNSELITNSYQKISNVTKSLISSQRAFKTAFDFGASLRQGMSYLGRKEFNTAFANQFKYAKSKQYLDDLEVEMLSHRYSEQALKYKRPLGLTLLGENFTQREEAFASKIIDKIPLLRGSERAYTGFLNNLRFNRFVNTIDRLENAGVNITNNPKAMEDLAQVIGNATGRGTFKQAESNASALSAVLFSPRWILSRVQTIMNPLVKTGEARIEAAKSLATIVGVSASILSLLKMAGSEVETDSTSADFGKIKQGNTRYDITGGLSPYIVLFERIRKAQIKSSTTGKITKLNTGKYGSKDIWGLLGDFISNRTSPVFSIIRDLAKGESMQNKDVKLEPTKDFAEYVAQQLFVPLVASDTWQAYADGEQDAVQTIEAFISSMFGVGVSTYK